MISKSIDYSQISLVPNFSTIKSRSELSTELDFLGHKFKNPAVPANMACTINLYLAKELSQSGYFYIMHRFLSYDEIFNWIRSNQNLQTISISVGVKEKDFKLIKRLYDADLRVDFITIDIAHGWHISVKETIEYIKAYSRGHFYPKIIAGNVMTDEATEDLIFWGADAVKIGLSQGKGCSTYNTTGVGRPMFSTILDCSTTGYPIIADGGIREIGDVCKALVAGANMVMIGSEFCMCKDSPADIQELNYGEEIGQKLSKKLKVYYGSASAKNKGYNKYVEGFEVRLPMKDETYFEYLHRIEQGIQSCMSYNGSNNISNLKNMRYIIK